MRPRVRATVTVVFAASLLVVAVGSSTNAGARSQHDRAATINAATTGIEAVIVAGDELTARNHAPALPLMAVLAAVVGLLLTDAPSARHTVGAAAARTLARAQSSRAPPLAG